MPLLSRDVSFYYGELPKEEMSVVLNDTRAEGWRAAITRYLDKRSSSYFVPYVVSPLRTLPRFLLNGFGRAVVLDYGCGLGSLTIALARSFQQVLATDLTWERAAFTALRASQEGMDNVSVFCSGNTPHIPLPDQSVDIVLLNGVLEWVPENQAGDPRELQVRFLREVRRVLRQEGTLYVAIENRSGHTYLRGAREDHTHLRFGALLPRAVANRYSLLMRKKPYRTYTYTARGYRKLLRESGFTRARFFGLAPDYRLPQRIVDLSDLNMIRNFQKPDDRRHTLRSFFIRPVLRSVMHSYGICASNSDREPFFRELMSYISTRAFQGRHISIKHFSASGESAAAQIWASCEQQGFLVRLPLSAAMEGRLFSAEASLNEVHASLNEDLRKKLAHPILFDRYQNQLFFAVSQLAGTNLATMNAQEESRWWIPHAAEFLTQFAVQTIRPVPSWSELCGRLAEEFCKDLASFIGNRFRGRVDLLDQLWAVRERIVSLAPSTPGFICATHGDFWHGNLLMTTDHRLSGVIDWDRFNPDSCPLLDLLYMLATYIRRTGRAKRVSPYLQLREYLAEPGVHADSVRDYMNKLSLPPELLPAAIMLTWLHRTRDDLCDIDRLAPMKDLKSKLLDPLEHFASS